RQPSISAAPTQRSSTFLFRPTPDNCAGCSPAQIYSIGLPSPPTRPAAKAQLYFMTRLQRPTDFIAESFPESHCRSRDVGIAASCRLRHYAFMAFRIHDSVVRGEIDNRTKGVVRGKIWVEGRPEPVVLELQGNAWPDLAGCLLTFTNPLKRIPHQHLDSLYAEQKGSIGDLTASRKVRVFDIPL